MAVKKIFWVVLILLIINYVKSANIGKAQNRRSFLKSHQTTKEVATSGTLTERIPVHVTHGKSEALGHSRKKRQHHHDHGHHGHRHHGHGYRSHRHHGHGHHGHGHHGHGYGHHR